MSMFPTPFSGSGAPDPNRSWKEPQPADGSWPKSLRNGFVFAILTAILMLLTALVMLTSGPMPIQDAPLDVTATYRSNYRIVAWGNIVFALALTVAATSLRRGSAAGRRWFAGLLFVTAFLNIVGFIVSVVGLAGIVIVALAAFAGLFAFRPAANEFIREKTWERRRAETQA